MTSTKRIVCLANSRKLNGRCVAGREAVRGRPGRWIRPVSSRENQEVSEYERQYEDGSDPRVLDIIDVPLIEARPSGHQSENWLLDPEWYWSRVGQLAWKDLAGYAEQGGPLWLNGDSTYNGLNDRITMEALADLHSSLRLIHVDNLQLEVFRPSEAFGNSKRRVQARFDHEKERYWLWITDPVYEQRYLSQRDGRSDLGACYLTLSLGELYKRACYKLVAAVIQPPSSTGVHTK